MEMLLSLGFHKELWFVTFSAASSKAHVKIQYKNMETIQIRINK